MVIYFIIVSSTCLSAKRELPKATLFFAFLPFHNPGGKIFSLNLYYEIVASHYKLPCHNNGNYKYLPLSDSFI